MSFLAPLFLAGLGLVAIPVIIHLTQRQRREPIAFPSLMFLRQIPFRSVKRQRIRHWLLFILRAAAVVLLAVAFARPLLDRPLGITATGGGREVVILLDHSYSMGYGDRWDRGVRAARRAVEGLGPDDRATLVLFADRAVAASPRTADGAVLQAALNGATLSARGTHYAPALELARELLQQSERPRREAVLITDFQASGWDRSEQVRLPEGAGLTRVDLSDPAPHNVAVTGIAVERLSRSGPDRVAVTARVVNRSPDPVPEQRVTLRIDGSPVETALAVLPANGGAVARFAPVPVPSRPVRATVEIAGDALPTDDRFHAVITPRRAIPVLLVEHPDAPPAERIYVRRALEIGDDPPMDMTTGQGAIGAEELAGRAVVIVNDAPLPSAAAASRMRRFVEAGGGLLVVLGRRTAQSQAAGLLPGTAGQALDRLADRGGTLADFDYDHPVFEVFRAPRSGDLTAARIFRYRRFDPDDSVRVLARFDDGAVALAERRVGAGRVMVWTAGFDNFWGDLPVQPVFLPFVHQLVRYLARYVPADPWVTAGDVLDLGSLDASAAGAAARTEWVVEAPSGARVMEETRGGARYVSFEEQGFYELRPVGKDGAARRIVAVNLDARESDLARLDPTEFAAAVVPAAGAGARAASLDVTLSPEERERRQGLWWYLLVAVLLLLVAETVLANRRPRRGPATV